MTRPRVLALDDSPTVLTRIEGLLSPTFEVATCTDWVKANLLVHEWRPQALVVDWELGSFRGTYLIRAIRCFFPPAQLPIVLISGSPDAAEATRDAGVSAFVDKKELERLPSTIGALLRSAGRVRA
jgi:CheY-like chemotaxis protein